MKITYTVKGIVKGKQLESDIVAGLSSATAADRAAAEAVSQGATYVKIVPDERDDKGESERIDMETAATQLESARKYLSNYTPGAPGEPGALRIVEERKAVYLAAVEAYRIARDA